MGNHHQYDLVGIHKEIDKPIEISFDKNEFKPVTISFYNINYIIGDESIKKTQCCQWQTEVFPF